MPRNVMHPPLARFVRKEDGALLIEYALIIAVVSLAMVLALQPVFVSGQIGTFIGRLSACLTGAGCA